MSHVCDICLKGAVPSHFIEENQLLREIEIPEDADLGLYLLTKYYAPWIANKADGLKDLQFIRYMTDIVLPFDGRFDDSEYLEKAQKQIEKIIMLRISKEIPLTTEEKIKELFNEMGSKLEENIKNLNIQNENK